MDHTTVVIANDCPKKNRSVYYQMVRRYGNNKHVKFIQHLDEMPTPELDENGTAKDEKYLRDWANILRQYDPNVTHIVTSDRYGKNLSDILGVKWLPIDPDRKTIPISGTKIRSDLFSFWNYIVPEAKSEWKTRIAIIGPESCGKSTMVDYVNDGLYGFIHGIPEYGRTLSEAMDNDVTIEDFESIINVQQQMMNSANQISPCVITDTEAITTYLFAYKYLSKEEADLFNINSYFNIIRNEIDHYIVLYPNVPWVDDGYRVMNNQYEQINFYNNLLKCLNKMNLPYSTVTSKSWTDRQDEVINIIRTVNRNRQTS